MKSEFRSCAHKITYATHADAQSVLNTIRKANARVRRKQHSLKAYHCAFCDKWHIGHNGAPKYSNYKRVKKFEWVERED